MSPKKNEHAVIDRLIEEPHAPLDPMPGLPDDEPI